MIAKFFFVMVYLVRMFFCFFFSVKLLKNRSGSNLLFRGLTFGFFLNSVHFLY